MENGLKRLRDLFSGRTIFNIPNYQRAYAWVEKHWEDFIEDLDNHSINADYFLGTILFQKNSGNNGAFDVIDVVDGQQRITTTIIFMKTLVEEMKRRNLGDVDLLEESYVKYKDEFRLRVSTDDNEYFKTYILGDTSGKDFIRTPSQKRLYQAKRYFEKQLKLKSDETLNYYKDKIDSHTEVLTYTVKSPVEATLIFETTNDRGKRLTDLEKIKSFLMYKCYHVEKENPDTLLSNIQSRFSNIYKEYEKISDKIDEDTLLQYHYIAFEWWTDKSEYQNVVDTIKQRINNLIKERKFEEAVLFIERFTKELKETFMTTVSVFANTHPMLRDLFLLDRMGNFFPLIIKTFKWDTDNNLENFYRLIRQLEIFSFRVYAVNEKRSNTGQSRLFTMARDFNGRFEDFISHAKSLTWQHSDDKIFEEYLTHPRIYEWMKGSDLRYLFWKYENHLRRIQQPVWPEMAEAEITTKAKSISFSIEHIAPQNPKESTVVEDLAILPSVTEKFQEEWLHQIGNLTIDPQSANSSKGRKEFDLKNSKYFIKAPLKTQNELEDFLSDSNKWDAEAIKKRAKKIVEFAVNYWNPSSY